MTFRNRTNEFKKLKELKNNHEFSLDSKYLLDNKNHSDITYNNINNNDINDLDYLIKITKIKIEKQFDELNKLQNKRLLVNFISDDNEIEIEIDNFVKEITNNFKLIQNIIIKISKINNINNIFKKNFIDTQSQSLQELISKLRKCQKSYLEKINEQKKLNSDEFFWNNIIKNDNSIKSENNNTIKSENNNNENIKNIKNNHSDKYYIHDKNNLPNTEILIQDEILENSINEYESLIEERDKEIIQIAKSIEELSELFKEVSTMVHKQGTMLDRIDYNMENAVQNVKSGNTHLIKADNYHKSSSATSQTVIYGLGGMIGLMAGLLVIKKKIGF